MHIPTSNNQPETAPSLPNVSLASAWLLVFSVTALYCYSHGVLLKHPVTSPTHSSLWAVSVWLPWVLLWPVAKSLRSSHNFFVCMSVLSIVALCGYLLLSQFLLPGGDIILQAFRYLPFELLIAWLMLFWLGRAGTEVEGVDTASAAQSPCDNPSDLPVSPDVILWVSAARNYVELFTENKSYLQRTTLTELYEALRSHGFVRTHRSHMVNAKALSHLKKKGARCYKAVLSDGTCVPVSVKHLKEIHRLISAR